MYTFFPYRQILIQRLIDADLRACIMRNQVWDAALAKLDALDLAELVLGLLSGDAVDGEAALGVVDEAEVLASLLDRDNVHEAGGVGGIGADLAIDLDEALHNNGLGLAAVEGVLQAVTDEDDQRHAVSELVGTGRGLGGVGTRQFVEKPVRRCRQAVLVLSAEGVRSLRNSCVADPMRKFDMVRWCWVLTRVLWPSCRL